MENCGMAGTLAIQAFNKADTTAATLDSVATCRGAQDYHLVILQDGWAGSKCTEEYREAQERTSRVIEVWVRRNQNRFLSISFNQLDRNYGAYATAERLVNQGLEKSAFVIFSEDDVIFECDALEWFEKAIDHPMFLRPNVWAIAGESRFFDSYRHVPSNTDIHRALDVAQSQRLIERFVYLNFLPSSCFATTRNKWAEFGNTRGKSNGDRAVVDRCIAEGKVCFWPVIGRCRDTGMHHPLGYSVRWKGLHHTAFKNSYVVSGMLKSATGNLTELSSGQKDALLDEFTRRWELMSA